MAPKGKKSGPAKDSKELLTVSEQESLKSRMSKKPCIRCNDYHTGYECKTKYKGMVGWYGGLSASKKTGVDAWMKHYQEESSTNNSGASSLNADPPAKKSSVDAPVKHELEPSVNLDADDLYSDIAQPLESKPHEPSGEAEALSTSLNDMTVKPFVGVSTAVVYDLVKSGSTATSMVQPQEPPNISLNDGIQYIAPKNLLSRLQQLSQSHTDFPVRKTLRNKTTDVVTNHFEIQIPKDAIFHEYRLTGIPKSTKSDMCKILVETAIANSPLQNLQDYFATDNIETIISWKSLAEFFPSLTSNYQEWDLCTIYDGQVDISVKLRYIGKVDTDSLLKYVNADVTSQADAHDGSGAVDMNRWNANAVVNALNIVISKHFQGGISKQGPNKFFIMTSHYDMQGSNSLCLVRGYSYTITPGMGKILLRINTITSAFWKPVLVSEVLADRHFKGKSGLLKGLKVYIEYQRAAEKPGSTLDDPHNRIKTINHFSKLGVGNVSFSKVTRDQKGNVVSSRQVTVQQHLQREYGVTCHDPRLPAVSTTKIDKPTWFSPEHLRIMPYQIFKKVLPDDLVPYMMTKACKSPMENKMLIEGEAMQTLRLNNQSPLRVTRSMLRVPCHVLGLPQINYGNSIALWNKQNTRWNLMRLRFYQPGPDTRNNQPLRYAMVTDRFPAHRVFELASEFEKQCVALGVGRPKSVQQPFHQLVMTVEAWKDTLKWYAEQLGDQFPHLIILVLSQKSYPIYAIFKYLADKVFGFQTIVVTTQNCKNLPQSMGNVAMKANLKRGGINHTVMAIHHPLKDTLVIGADVTHPGPGALPGCPSIAAVVGSVDATGGKFLGDMKLQPGKQELIDDMDDFLAKRIIAWYKVNRNYPANILYYRDGVSESQYEAIKDHELAKVGQACALVEKELKLAPSTITVPRVTAVVVTKRHGTRFYPIDHKYTSDDKYKNCVPGVLVDQGVTSPYWDDFYLQSHHALKGTAKSAHYFIIRNEMRIPTSDLQKLTHNLNHTYVRATMGVSYASPAYYADRLCERGRVYLRDFLSPTEADRESSDQDKTSIERDNPKPNQQAERNVENGEDQRGRFKKSAAEVERQRQTQTNWKKVIDGKIAALVFAKCEAKLKAEGEYVPAERFATELANRKEELQETMYWM